MVVVIVAYISSLGRSRSDEDPNLLELVLKSEADVQRRHNINLIYNSHNLNLIYNSTNSECIDKLCMGKAPFFALCKLFR